MVCRDENKYTIKVNIFLAVMRLKMRLEELDMPKDVQELLNPYDIIADALDVDREHIKSIFLEEAYSDPKPATKPEEMTDAKPQALRIASKPADIIPQYEVERIHGTADYGGITPREVIAYGLLKVACNFGNGSTTRRILSDHGLISDINMRGLHNITGRGRKYLWACFGRNIA